MKTAPSLNELNAAGDFADVVLACGVFDGVHRGHQQILAALANMARQVRARPVVLTFDPHPRAVLHPHAAPALLSLAGQRLRLFAEAGAEGAVILPFTRDVAGAEPRDFVTHHLLGSGVRLRGICVGRNWRFGAGGRGDMTLLRQLGREFDFTVLPAPDVLYYGSPISSTRIRRAIHDGRMEFAARLLGRPYAVGGVVQHGKGAGVELLACPTANLKPVQLLPPHGVYAANGLLAPAVPGAPATRHPGIAYIGTCPTFAASGHDVPCPVLEFHLFDFSGDLYGQGLEVELLTFVRPDQAFPTVAELRTQIAADVAAVRGLANRTA